MSRALIIPPTVGTPYAQGSFAKRLMRENLLGLGIGRPIKSMRAMPRNQEGASADVGAEERALPRDVLSSDKNFTDAWEVEVV